MTHCHVKQTHIETMTFYVFLMCTGRYVSNNKTQRKNLNTATMKYGMIHLFIVIVIVIIIIIIIIITIIIIEYNIQVKMRAIHFADILNFTSNEHNISVIHWSLIKLKSSLTQHMLQDSDNWRALRSLLWLLWRKQTVWWWREEMETLPTLLALCEGNPPLNSGSPSQRDSCADPDSKVHGANMGPIWGRQDPGGPHVGLMNFAIWGALVFYFMLAYKSCWTNIWVAKMLMWHHCNVMMGFNCCTTHLGSRIISTPEDTTRSQIMPW